MKDKLNKSAFTESTKAPSTLFKKGFVTSPTKSTKRGSK